MATPRGITQPHTSFIGSACQGIHHTPVTKHTDTQTNRYKHQNTKKKDTRVHYTVLTQHNPTHKQPQHKQSSMQQGPNRNNQCCPRHPTVHQHKNTFVTLSGVSTKPHTPRGRTTPLRPHAPPSRRRNHDPRVCLHPAKTNNVAVTHSATQPHSPTTAGTQIQAP